MRLDDTSAPPGRPDPLGCRHQHLGLNTDHQQWAYILRRGDAQPPEGIQRLMAEANRLQNVFMSEFMARGARATRCWRASSRARAEGIPNPRVLPTR